MTRTASQARLVVGSLDVVNGRGSSALLLLPAQLLPRALSEDGPEAGRAAAGFLRSGTDRICTTAVGISRSPRSRSAAVTARYCAAVVASYVCACQRPGAVGHCRGVGGGSLRSLGHPRTQRCQRGRPSVNAFSFDFSMLCPLIRNRAQYCGQWVLHRSAHDKPPTRDRALGCPLARHDRARLRTATIRQSTVGVAASTSAAGERTDLPAPRTPTISAVLTWKRH